MEVWERARSHSGHIFSLRLCRDLLCWEQHGSEGQQELAHSRLLSFCGNSAKNLITSPSGKPCPKDTAHICKSPEAVIPFQIFLSGFMVC